MNRHRKDTRLPRSFWRHLPSGESEPYKLTLNIDYQTMSDEAILCAEQVRGFQEQRFLAIEALTTQEDVSFLREIHDALFAERRGRDAGDQFDLAGTDEEGQKAALPQILGPAKYAPELNDSLLRQNCSLALSDLFGQEVQAEFDHAIFKPAMHGAETPWHQDAACSGTANPLGATMRMSGKGASA